MNDQDRQAQEKRNTDAAWQAKQHQEAAIQRTAADNARRVKLKTTPMQTLSASNISCQTSELARLANPDFS